MNTHDHSRRNFIKNATSIALAAPFVSRLDLPDSTAQNIPFPKIHIFSKHLQFLNYKDMADAAKMLGFDGVDLTIRPNGHVDPVRVADELPRAAEELNKVGLPPQLFCTNVESAANPVDVKLLQTASKLGFKYYRMAWYRYNEKEPYPTTLERYSDQVGGISKLNQKLGLVGCYQNHAGRLVGSSLWEVHELLQKANREHMGTQYDIRHAVVEGGLSWQNGLELIRPTIKTIVLKDTQWAKRNGKWYTENVPLGEGMVDWLTYFKYIKTHAINVPFCLHLEYPIGGAENGATTLTVSQHTVFEAMKRDLARAKELWEKA